jgi:cation transport ATPase
MDKLNELSHGAKVVLGAAIAFLIVSFFNWQEVDLGPIGEAGVSMWDGIGWLAGLLAIALIVWQAIRLANINVEIGVTPAMVTAALALLLLIFTFIKFLVDNEFRTFWAWLGLALAIVVAVGAWLNMQAAGESVQNVMDRFGSRPAETATTTTTTTATPPPPPSTTTPDEPPASTEPDRTP